VSRATSIWTVFNEQQDLLAAFTVQHEMVSWLGCQASVENWLCVKVPDNPSRYMAKVHQRIPAEDFL
jgi:hypothetical protein